MAESTGWTVIGLQIAPATRLAMRRVEAVTVHTGSGIQGDRYAASRHRHVSLQSTSMLEAAAAKLGAAIDPLLTRRNITVAGPLLPTQPGSRFVTGDVELEVVRRAAPCRLLDDAIGPGAAAAMRGHGGVICRVVKGGGIERGALMATTCRATDDDPI